MTLDLVQTDLITAIGAGHPIAELTPGRGWVKITPQRALNIISLRKGKDLKIMPKEPMPQDAECWVNVYMTPKGYLELGDPHDTLDKAQQWRDKMFPGDCGCLKITVQGGRVVKAEVA